MAVHSRVCSVFGREFRVTVYNHETPVNDDLSDQEIMYQNEIYNLLISQHQLITYNMLSRVNPNMKKHYFNALVKTSNNSRIEILNIKLKKKIDEKTITNRDLRRFIQGVSQYGGPNLQMIFKLEEQPTEGLQTVLYTMQKEPKINNQERYAIGLVIALLKNNRRVVFPNEISGESLVALRKDWNNVFNSKIHSMVNITKKFIQMKRSSNRESNFRWNTEDLQVMSKSLENNLTQLQWLHDSYVSHLTDRQTRKFTEANTRMNTHLKQIESKIKELKSG